MASSSVPVPVPGGEQEDPEGNAHFVPECTAGSEEGADALIQAIDQVKDLVHEERQQVEREERLRQVLVAVAEVVLQVVALVLEVRRGKALYPSGCESRPATVALAGSSRSGARR